MSLDLNAPARLLIPESRRRARWPWFLALVLIAGSGYGAWRAGLQPSRLWAKQAPLLTTLEVDRGDIDVYVTENGSLEGGNNATVFCKVEALIGQVGGAQGAMGGAAGGTRAGGQGGPAGTQGGAGGQPGGQAAPPPAPAKKVATRGGAAAKAGAAKVGAASKSSAAAAEPAAVQPAATGKGAGGGGGGAAAPTATTTASAVNAIQRPMIRSFSLMVMRHTPLRPAKPANQAQTKTQAVDPSMGGGGGRGGGRRGGGGGGMAEEKPGATRIISILPEGTRVKAGDLVCEFDSSAFRDEVAAQKIRYIQAQAWVKQAKELLEVSEISLEEYRDGIYPQDKQLIGQYIATCKTEAERAKRNLRWSQDIFNRGFRAKTQVNADALNEQQAVISLEQAERMMERLEKYTRPKLIKSLEAKVEAIRADQLSQEASFQIEADRLKRLEKMVENCTLRAPRDGIVVYVNQSNGWGSNQVQIQEGTTVREGQPIFSVPDPSSMQVRAKVNESKVALIHSGQQAIIRVDAYPDRLLRGKVGEVTAIPSAANRLSDVKIYFATVTIENGFDGLRPGLSAEVDFFCETRTKAIRVPLQAVRTVGGQSFAAVRLTDQPSSGPSWQWVRVELGKSNATYAEVVSGLKPGDQVVGQPDLLPAPQPVTTPVQTALSRSS